VLGNGISIVDGDVTPGSTDHTNFGSVVQGDTALTRRSPCVTTASDADAGINCCADRVYAD